MVRTLKLFSLFVKIGLMRGMAYRPHFFMMVVGKVLRIGLLRYPQKLIHTVRGIGYMIEAPEKALPPKTGAEAQVESQA